MSFVYYIPKGKAVPTPQQLAELGLSHAFMCSGGKVIATAAQVARGPSDSGSGPAGSIVADHRHLTVGRIGYYPDRQTWRPLVSGRAWVGMYNAEPPTPATLVRDSVLPGVRVELKDGHSWQVPLVRGLKADDDSLVFSEALPHISTVNAQGRWVPGEIVPRYAHLWPLACEWFALRLGMDRDGDGPDVHTYDGVHRAAVAMLAANYRIGDCEAAMLGILDESVVMAVMDAAADVRMAVEWLEKKTRAGGSASTGDGLTAGIPDIGLPAQTST